MSEYTANIELQKAQAFCKVGKHFATPAPKRGTVKPSVWVKFLLRK